MMSSAGEAAGATSTAVDNIAAVDEVLGAAAAAAAGGVASGGSAAVADTPGFHEWMVRRLQATLQQFDAEQKLLQKELQMLQALSSSKGLTAGLTTAAAGSAAQAAWIDRTSSSSSAMWSRVKRWMGVAGSSSSTAAQPHAAALGGSSSEDGGGPLTAAGIAARMADIREQVESLDVLKAALAAEAAEQQRQQVKAEAAQG
jgi:hypothetical protein